MDLVYMNERLILSSNLFTELVLKLRLIIDLK